MNDIGTQDIRTDRLLLRRIRLEDAQALCASGSFTGTSAEVADNLASRVLPAYQQPYAYHWAIEYGGRAVGRIHAWEVSGCHEFCQLGYDLAPECRNQGLMTEALRAVLACLLTQAEFNRVYCSVRVRNAASNKVCQKAGMTLEGTLRKHFKREDGWDDVNVYAILRDDLPVR